MRPDANWTNGSPNIAPGDGLADAVARAALFRPEAVALIDGDRKITYADLDHTADSWAALLLAEGVGKGDIVPILLPRGPQLVTALVAVLKTGAAYALLDQAWPAQRVREVAAIVGAPLLIADAEVDTPLPRWSPPEHPPEPPAGFRPARTDAIDPCCVFFTSGTTGKPKGVLTTHRATARLFQHNSFASFGPDTVMPLAAPTPWDAFSLELWSVLLNGGTALIIGDRYLSADALRNGHLQHGVDTVWLTSSLFNMIVEEDIAAFAGLTQVMIGGERLSPSHVKDFLAAHPRIRLLNGYGPVESVVFATTHPITAADCARPGGIPLGRPVPGTRVFVLDGDRPCEVGEVGEICVAGDGLAAGYLGDPELTAAKFTDVRLDGRSQRVYRTGDLGTWDADGLLDFAGRADRQLKIRGHRIEPADIESQIERLPAVRRCQLVAHRDDTGATRDLLAFCVPDVPGDPLDGVLTSLRTSMPAYQLPAAVISVDAIPLTPQGKLDERALLAMAAPPRRLDTGDSPEDATTALVAATFAAVIGEPKVAAGTSFFELGGNSLGAGRACARLAAQLDRPVPLVQIYRHPSAAALAAWLDATEAPDSTSPTDEVPLTPMQLVHLTRHLLDPAAQTAHCLLFWQVRGELDRDSLQAAIDQLHLRHEPLSTSYVADPTPTAWLEDVPAPLLVELPEQPSIDAAVRVLRAELAGPLDPPKADIWRTALVRAGDAILFGCVIHHIAFDGWSESVFARELAAAYNGTIGQLPEPPTLGEIYRATDPPCVDATRSARARSEFQDVPDLRWPPGPLAATGMPDRVEVGLPPDIVTRVDDVAAATGQTRFVVLLSQWAAALSEVSGQRDFAVGVPIAQRTDSLLHNAIGCHIVTVPLRLRGNALSGDVVAAGEVVARGFADQDLPLQELLGPTRAHTGRPPLFQVLFALQDNEPPPLPLNGTRTTFLRQPYLDLPLELHTELWPTADGCLRLEVAFRPDAVPIDIARQLAERFLARLRTVTAGGTP